MCSENFLYIWYTFRYFQIFIYIQRYKYWYIFRYIRYIHNGIYSDTFRYFQIFRNIYNLRNIHMRIKYSRHTKCAAGILILVIIDIRDMVALFLQYYTYCIHTAFQMLSKYFWKLGNGITCS